MDILYKIVTWFFSIADTWYSISISGSFFILFLIGFSPAFNISMVDETYTIKTHLALKLRQLAWLNLILSGIALPAVAYLCGYLYLENTEDLNQSFIDLFYQTASNSWVFIALAVMLGFGLQWAYSRHAKPKWSAFKRRWSVRQTGEELSDIRKEKDTIKTKTFEPAKHYKDGYFFWGLDQENKPIYDTVSDWFSRHFRLVGPTQTGKGVEIGVVLDQCIRLGNTVFFIDPKPDKFARKIMKQTCEEIGRPFVELDLRPAGKGRYEPFLGGDERQARTRLAYILGLNDTGDAADFYKSTERRIIDSIFGEWDRRLHSLKGILESDKYFSDVKRSLNYIEEWLRIPTFRVNKNKRGFSVEECFKNNAVVYIRGDLDDEVINKACTVLLMEICQERKRLHEINECEKHTTLVIDEVAFLINEQIADALATVAGFDMNIGLAYQSEGDLLNLKDKTLNAKAISGRVKVNCKNALYYMAVDAETAEIMADESGTIYKSVTRSQGVEVGNLMEETWDKNRDIHKVDENLITMNKAKMLPERVGVLYRPNQLASFCHTSWIEILETEADNKTVETEKTEPVSVNEKTEPTFIIEDLPALDKKENPPKTNDEPVTAKPLKKEEIKTEGSQTLEIDL